MIIVTHQSSFQVRVLWCTVELDAEDCLDDELNTMPKAVIFLKVRIRRVSYWLFHPANVL